METAEGMRAALASAALLLALGLVCGVLARRLGVPNIVLYLLSGMAVGPAGLGLVDVPVGSGLHQAQPGRSDGHARKQVEHDVRDAQTGGLARRTPVPAPEEGCARQRSAHPFRSLHRRSLGGGRPVAV